METTAQPLGCGGYWSRVKTLCKQGRRSRPRKSCCMSAVMHEGNMVLYGGGVIEQLYDDVFQLNLDTHVWRRLHPTGAKKVPPSLSHTAVLWENMMIVFGGMGSAHCLNSVFSLTISDSPRWEELEVTGDIPAPRKGHAATVWGTEMFVFMGADYRGSTFRDIYSLDLVTRVWKEVHPRGSKPPSRTGHSLAHRRECSCCYIFGGMMKEEKPAEWLSDLWKFDFTTSTFTELPQLGEGPEGRYSQISWATESALYVFGGDTVECTKYFDDLWEYSFAGSTWRKLNIPGDRPSARSGHVCSLWRGCLFMFGGEKPRKRDGPESPRPVTYSNTLYQMPHYIDPNTTLKSIVTRYIISNNLFAISNWTNFRSSALLSSLPPDLIEYIDSMRPRGQPVKRSSPPTAPVRKRIRLDCSAAPADGPAEAIYPSDSSGSDEDEEEESSYCSAS